MLKKFFKWGKASSPPERDSFSASQKDAQRDPQSSGSERVARYRGNEAHSGAPDARGLGVSSSAQRLVTAPGTHPQELQEISSTVVCDFGEMDASSPVVQQVKQQIAGDAFGVQTGDGPKIRATRRQRDSWPPRLKGSVPSDGNSSPNEDQEMHSPPGSPLAAVEDQTVWHWSPAALSPMSRDVSDQVADLQCDEGTPTPTTFVPPEGAARWSTSLPTTQAYDSSDRMVDYSHERNSFHQLHESSLFEPIRADENCPPFTLVPSEGRSAAIDLQEPIDLQLDARESEHNTVDTAPDELSVGTNLEVNSHAVDIESTNPDVSSASHDGHLVANHTQSPRANGSGHAGALMEGHLAILAKKKKNWEDHYCILSCKPREHASFGGIDFAYMLEFYSTKDEAVSGHHPVESIHAGHSSIKFVQGTVFTIKTSGELNKKGATHFLSANSVEETKAWLSAMHLVPDVHVDWVGKDGVPLS